jgi:hypothetical protein
MSIRYRCSAGVCPLTINAHDARVLEQLPLHLQAEFPAQLTHRSGISRQLADTMRSLVQNSVGPKRIAKLLREWHTLHHDRLELQYLNSLHHRLLNPTVWDAFSNSAQEPFSTFSDITKYAGFVPSATYLRLAYTSLIEELRPLIEKQIMLLDGRILKGDHSFKLVKHLSKVEGSPVFTALYTLCNEYEEIRMQVLVPSKAVAHLEVPFENMRKAFDLYGHAQPEVFFTDNVTGDRQFLERVLPSLTRSVSASELPRRTHLPLLQLPSDDVHFLCQGPAIERAINCILDDVRGIEPIHVAMAFQMSKFSSGGSKSLYTQPHHLEIFRTNTHGLMKIAQSWKTSVMQIAYNSRVLVIQLSQLRNLPSALLTLLTSGLIIKIGRNLGFALNTLNMQFSLERECSGSLDIATFCCDRGLIPYRSASLDDLCASVLRQKLHVPDTQLSTCDWSTARLTPKQIEHAAMKAWAILKIYSNARHSPTIRSPILGKPDLGTHVALFPRSIAKAAAYGTIREYVSSSNRSRNDVQMVEVTISRVEIPAMIPDFNDKSLAECFPLPFTIRLGLHQLRVCNHPNSAAINSDPQVEGNCSKYAVNSLTAYSNT